MKPTDTPDWETYAEIPGTNYAAVQESFLRISSQQARVGKVKSDFKRLLGEAKCALEEAKTELGRVHALLYLKLRETNMGEDSKGKPKPPSETTLNSLILQEERYQEAQAELHACELSVVDAQHAFDRAYEACEAVKTKRDALNSLAADRRAELATDPNLRKMAREDREEREGG